MFASQDSSLSTTSAPNVLKDSSMISINVSVDLSAEPTKSTTSSLKNANVLKTTTSLMVHAPDVNQNKLTTSILNLATSLLAQASMNTSQLPPRPASASPDTSESEEPAPTVTQDTTMIVTLTDVSASQDTSKREVSARLSALLIKSTSMESVNAITDFLSTTESVLHPLDVP